MRATFVMANALASSCSAYDHRFMMLRSIIVSFFASCVLVGAAFAQADNWSTWTDPGNQLRVDHPTAWYVHPMTSLTEGAVRVSVGAADYECQVWSLPRASSATANAEAVRARYARPISEADWTEIAGGLPEFRRGLTVTQQGVDASGAWPLQHVSLVSTEHQARGTIQGRPGRELISICLSYDGQDRTPIFERIERSIGLPSD